MASRMRRTFLSTTCAIPLQDARKLAGNAMPQVVFVRGVKEARADSEPRLERTRLGKGVRKTSLLMSAVREEDSCGVA